MKRHTVILGALVSCVIAIAACKKEDPEPITVPVPTSTAAAPAPPAAGDDAGAPGDAGAGDDASAPGAAAGDPAQPQTPVTTHTPTKQESIDACCNALRSVQKSGKSAAAKAKAAQAAAICPGIAKLVKTGTTSRSAGLSQIRSALVGFDVPGECR